MTKEELIKEVNKTRKKREMQKKKQEKEVMKVEEKKLIKKQQRYRAKDFTKEELEYYKGTGEFHIGAKEYAEINDCEEEDNYEHITNMAYCDLAYKKPRRQPEDFRNNSEYMLYDATLFGAIIDIENGFGERVLG